jgi:hypothetical protein
MLKENAPELLRRELSSPKWKPQELTMSGVTDCYQPIERKLQLTRRCLAVLAEFRNPVSIITKNFLVTRDLDLLRELAAHQAVHVSISLTTLDSELARKLEPRAASPKQRLAAMELLSAPLKGEPRRTVPVNQSAGALAEGCEPHLWRFIWKSFLWRIQGFTITLMALRSSMAR